MANYAIDPSLLTPYIPRHTEPDFWNGQCYVSLVGFRFADTRVLGVRVPLHTDFEEVNLRFYVRCHGSGGEVKRGVVFIREIVPRTMIAFIANRLYGEKYIALPMKHEWKDHEQEEEVAYRWKFEQQWHHLKVFAEKDAVAIEQGSAEEFIAEHYWGYTRLSEFLTMEYEVEHPSWKIHKVKKYDIQCDFGRIYGNAFNVLNLKAPDSIFMADGSDIVVRTGRRKNIKSPER